MATSVNQTSVNQHQMRNVCLTLNNYSAVEYDSILSASSKCKYLICAKEVGDSGTPHLQMYVEFHNPKTLNGIKKLLGSDRFHIEARRGTAQQASDYCKYADYSKETHTGTVLNDYVEFGEISKQGLRTDWAQAVESLTNSNDSIVDIIVAQPQLAPCVRALERIRQLAKCDPIQRDVKVIVLYGDAGTGKTFYANQLHPELYSKPNGEWWDGYNGESAVLMDDFYGGILYAEMLKVLDRYKLRVPVKGGFVGARWDTVYITSNKPPSEWYHHGMTPALQRRITECYKLEKQGSNTVWYSDDLEGKLSYLHTKNSKTGDVIQPTPVVPQPQTPPPPPTNPYEYKPVCVIPDVKPSPRNPIIRKKILIPKPHTTPNTAIHNLFKPVVPKIDLPHHSNLSGLSEICGSLSNSVHRSCSDDGQE